MNIYQKISRGALGLLAFLLPLFFLPFLSDSFEAGKQLLLVTLVLVSLLAWLGSVAISKEFNWRGGWLGLFPLFFLVSFFLASLFSLAGYQTWIGQAFQEYASFTTAAALIVVFYLLAQQANDLAGVKSFVSVFLLSALLSLVLAAANIFGWIELLWLSGAGANTVGTINTFVIFIISAAILALGLWLIPKKSYLFFGIAAVVLSVAALIFTAAIDFWMLWFLLVFGLALIMIFVFLNKTTINKTGRLFFPALLLLISAIVFFTGARFEIDLPVVVSPSYSASFSIAKQVLSENPTRLAFGSGPGTFTFDYAKYKSLETNQTIFWSSNFDRAKSFFLTHLATTGAFGATTLVLMVLAVILIAWRGLPKVREESQPIFLAIFSGWSVLVLSHFLYSSNMTLNFSFWALTGLLAGLLPAGVKKINFVQAPRLNLVFSLCFALVSVSAVIVLVFAGRFAAADASFVKAAIANKAGESAEQVANKLGQATALNEFSDIYYRNLSQALLVSAGRGLGKVTSDGTEVSEAEAVSISEVVKAALSSADLAVALSPNNVTNWIKRAQVYHGMINLVGGAEDAAAVSYLKAAELEPNNPFILTGLSRLYLTIADRARSLKNSDQADLAEQAELSENSSLSSAEKYLLQAITLKEDYAPAHYYLAAVFERQGRLKEAADRLLVLREQNQTNIGLGFQLSMLYIRLEDYSSAKVELEHLLELSPKYSNARWYLAAIYEVEGNLEAAIEQVEKVAELNSDNQTVLIRLENLRAGLLAAQIPEPIEEGDAEIKLE